MLCFLVASYCSLSKPPTSQGLFWLSVAERKECVKLAGRKRGGAPTASEPRITLPAIEYMVGTLAPVGCP